MNTLLTFIWVYLGMFSLSFIESYVEGRNAWDKNKYGWILKFRNGFKFSGYHYYLFFVMLPIFMTLPLIVYGWDTRLFGILMSAYFSGLVLEDFCYFIVNPLVKFKEFWSDFTNFYPWIRFNGKKIIPLLYIYGILISLLFWFFLWR